mmetsp:Transcript_43240/g.71841  ORF Transcript_43240/g.71841 Transcript_43240/m.71841 type:complete len:1174 (-) Transcript_43240:148-3669(-)
MMGTPKRGLQDTKHCRNRSENSQRRHVLHLEPGGIQDALQNTEPEKIRNEEDEEIGEVDIERNFENNNETIIVDYGPSEDPNRGSYEWRKDHYPTKMMRPEEEHFGYEYVIAVTDFRVKAKSSKKRAIIHSHKTKKKDHRRSEQNEEGMKMETKIKEEMGIVRMEEKQQRPGDNPKDIEMNNFKDDLSLEMKEEFEYQGTEEDGEEVEVGEMTDNEQLLGYLLMDIKSTFPNSVVIRSTESSAKTLIILIAVSTQDLANIADRTKPYMKLNNVRAHARAYQLDLPLAAHFQDSSEVWQDIYAPFEEDYISLFETYEEAKPGDQKGFYATKFREAERLNLIDYVVNDEDLINGLNLDEKYASIFEAAFPLHNESERDYLMNNWRDYTYLCFKGSWCKIWPFAQPVNLIERYLGQKIALYFEFLRMHTMFLILPAILGIMVYGYQILSGNVDNLITAAYSLFVVIHFFVFCRIHIQHENNLSSKWGSSKVHEEGKIRPEYKGEIYWSKIDGSLQLELPRQEKCCRSMLSGIAVIGIVVFIYAALVGGFFAEQGIADTVFAGSIFAVVLVIVNALTRLLAQMLTDFSNPKTTLEYKGELIIKLTIFKFMTGFGLLYYSAFIQDKVEGDCGETSCEQRTANLLRGTFIGMIIINNMLEIGVPMILSLYGSIVNVFNKYWKGEEQDHESPLELQLRSNPYEGTLDDYDELINQIGFTTFFVPFFPIAPALAILNNIIEVHVDSTKICYLLRRPVPERAASSLEWNQVLEAFSYIMLLTNSASIMFRFESVSTAIGISTITERFFGFLLICVVICLIKIFIINPLIPEKLSKVKQHTARQEYLWPFLLGIKKRLEDLEFSYEYDTAKLQDIIVAEKKHHRNDVADYSTTKPVVPTPITRKGAAFPQQIHNTKHRRKRISHDNRVSIDDLLRKGKHLPTFFTGGRSPIMTINVEFKNGGIHNLHILNEPPTAPPEPICPTLCCCCCCCPGHCEYNNDEEKEDRQDKKQLVHVGSQLRQILDAKGKIINDGSVSQTIQSKKGDGRFVTNVFMRFDNEDDGLEYAKLVGISFEINFKREESTRIWIGQQKGGYIVDLASTEPSTGEVGRPGAVVGLKGVRIGHNFLALEWLCMVFPKVLQMTKTADKRIKVIKEDSKLYRNKIVPQIYYSQSKFFPGKSMHV